MQCRLEGSPRAGIEVLATQATTGHRLRRGPHGTQQFAHVAWPRAEQATLDEEGVDSEGEEPEPAVVEEPAAVPEPGS